MSHVEFTYATETLVASGPPVDCDDWLDLYRLGPSRGENLTVARSDGTLSRARERGELAADLGWTVQGRTTIDGGVSPAPPIRQARGNVRDLALWFDQAPGRNFTVRLVDDELGVWEADAQHEEWGKLDWHGMTIFVRQLITLNKGLMTKVET